MIPGLECFSAQYYDCAITYVYTYVYASRVINVYTYVGSYCHANVYYAQINKATHVSIAVRKDVTICQFLYSSFSTCMHAACFSSWHIFWAPVRMISAALRFI